MNSLELISTIKLHTMSILKSSVINLYDALSGQEQFQAKVSSDRADLLINTLPLNITGTKVNISNYGGGSVLDVVGTVVAIKQSVIDAVAASVAAVSAEAGLRVSGDAAVQTAANSEVSNRTTAMATETTARVAAETVIANNLTVEIGARASAITSEISARSAADTALQTNITAEAKSRADADVVLQTNITAEAKSRLDADTLEITARNTAITSAVATELSARVAQDAVLQTNITAEAKTRADADVVLQTNITAEATARAAADTAEATARVSGDATVQTAVNNEITARTAADGVLQSNITAESNARGLAVSNEITARTNADGVLQSNIAAEQTRAMDEVKVERSRIDALLAGSSISLDSLLELVNAYTTSDTNILSQIATMTATITGIQTSLSSTNTTLSTLLSTAEVVQSVSFTQLGSDFANDGLFTAFSMSGDGTMIALGNPSDDTILTPGIVNLGHGNSGQVRCYKYSGVSNSWVLCGTIQGAVGRGQFGGCVSLSYDGFSLACSSKGEENGRISLFNYSNSTWTKLADKVGTNTPTGHVGLNVKISGNGTVLISGSSTNSAAGASLGMAQVWKYSSGSLTQLGANFYGEGDGVNTTFGSMTGDDSMGNADSLTINYAGDYIALGAYGNDGGGTNAGSVRVYQWVSTAWVKMGADIDGSAGDNIGQSCSLSQNGKVLAVGGWSGSIPGVVRVYSYNGTSWIKMGSDIVGTEAGSVCGRVSLSALGTTLAVGIYASDLYGTNAGLVRMYKYANNIWNKVGDDLKSSIVNDYVGGIVQLSSDASVISYYSNSAVKAFKVI